MRGMKIILFLLVTVICVSFYCHAEKSLLKGAEEIALPAPKHEGEVSVEQAIYRRRSIRSFEDTPLTISDVSQILWSAGGETADGITGPTRAYPSAGATYPLEIYIVAGNVSDLEPGVYKYNWDRNSLSLVKKGDLRRELSAAAFGQSMIESAPATIVVTAAYERTTRRYGRRGRTRYVSMDAGHLGQNVHLQAEGLGLGTVMVGAFDDKKVSGIIDPGQKVPVYMMPVGKPR